MDNPLKFQEVISNINLSDNEYNLLCALWLSEEERNGTDAVNLVFSRLLADARYGCMWRDLNSATKSALVMKLAEKNYGSDQDNFIKVYRMLAQVFIKSYEKFAEASIEVKPVVNQREQTRQLQLVDQLTLEYYYPILFEKEEVRKEA